MADSISVFDPVVSKSDRDRQLQCNSTPPRFLANPSPARPRPGDRSRASVHPTPVTGTRISVPVHSNRATSGRPRLYYPTQLTIPCRARTSPALSCFLFSCRLDPTLPTIDTMSSPLGKEAPQRAGFAVAPAGGPELDVWRRFTGELLDQSTNCKPWAG